MFRSERRLRRRNRFLGEVSEGAVEAPSDEKHGGSPIGRPGMPAFGYHLKDDDITELLK